jgi:hypothetical protein
MSAGGYYFDLSSNAELTLLEQSNPVLLHRILSYCMQTFEWDAAPRLEDVLLLPLASYAPFLKTHYQDVRNVMREVLVEPTGDSDLSGPLLRLLFADRRTIELHQVAVVNEAYPWEGSAPQVPILRHRLRDYHTSSEW